MINNVYISYFYQVRNMNNKLLPISTAKWDPKWFHNFKDHSYIFIDKNGVFNGVRCEELSPGESCEGLCSGPDNCLPFINPPECEFLKAYKDQLDKINFEEFMDKLSQILKSYSIATGVKNPTPVFLVYEKPDNPCSERNTIINWLHKNGITCEEFNYNKSLI